MSTDSIQPHRPCPDCDAGVNRRDFLKTTVATAAGAGIILPALGNGVAPAVAKSAAAAPKSETLVATLYKSLTDEQKKMICFPFEHDLRHEVENNWRITKARVGQDFTDDQQAMIREIFVNLHSPEYADKVVKQVEQDNGRGPNGFDRCSVAIFGEPGTGKFEFVFTGRHVTRRCDGDSTEGTAFGGPIFYGHAAQGFHEKPDHPGNAYWFQGVQANKLFAALDGKQRKLALRQDPRGEDGLNTVKLSGKADGLPGVPMSDLTADQKALAKKVMADLLAPFRKEDAAESMKLIEKHGFDQLHMAYYNNKGADLGKDGVWDVWQIEGPNMIWYFRGAPHVHTWVHIRG